MEHLQQLDVVLYLNLKLDESDITNLLQSVALVRTLSIFNLSFQLNYQHSGSLAYILNPLASIPQLLAHSIKSVCSDCYAHQSVFEENELGVKKFAHAQSFTLVYNQYSYSDVAKHQTFQIHWGEGGTVVGVYFYNFHVIDKDYQFLSSLASSLRELRELRIRLFADHNEYYGGQILQLMNQINFTQGLPQLRSLSLEASNTKMINEHFSLLMSSLEHSDQLTSLAMKFTKINFEKEVVDTLGRSLLNFRQLVKFKLDISKNKNLGFSAVNHLLINLVGLQHLRSLSINLSENCLGHKAIKLLATHIIKMG